MMKFTYVLPSNVARPRRRVRGLVLILCETTGFFFQFCLPSLF